MSNSNEVTATIPLISEESFRSIGSFADAVALANETYGGVVTAAELLSDGFASIDKEELINKPFLVLAYRINKSKDHFDENGEAAEFVIVRIVFESGEKYFFTDGSTGVLTQFQKLQSHGIYGGVMAPKGLRVSEYEYTNDSGKKSIAKTFYVNSDAAKK